MKNLKKELKKSKESKTAMEIEFSKCERALKDKTEEVEKLKTEIKDMKEIVAFERFVGENDDVEKSSIDNEGENVSDRRVPKMPSKPSRPTGVEKRTQRVAEFNCRECSFQGTSKEELSKHINIKHRVEGSMNCRICGESFTVKANLMNHRKNKHLKTVASCRNNLKGTCSFTNKKCWWNHADPDIGMDVEGDVIECFICNVTFKSKGSMMIHRKKEHKAVVRKCNLFEENRCGFKEEACWYNHDDKNDTEEGVDDENETEMQTQSVFQNAQEDLEPPIVNPKPKKD